MNILNATPMAVMLKYPEETLPTLQPGALAKAVSANLTALRHTPYELAENLLTFRQQELQIRTDPMISQMAKAQKLDALLVGIATETQNLMDDVNEQQAKMLQTLATMLYPTPDTNQQLLYEMRMQAAWQRAMRMLDQDVTAYTVIAQAGEANDRVMLAVLLRELPTYATAAMGIGSEARREKENLTDTIAQVVRTMLTPTERDAANMQDELATGLSQLRTSVGFVQQEIASQRGTSVYSGQGYRTHTLIGWSKGFIFNLDDTTLSRLSDLESQDMARLGQ